MALGSLNVEKYGGYMVQDTAYLANAAKMYTDAAQKMEEESNPDFALFYREQAKKYDTYYEHFLKTWRLENADAVEKGPAVLSYMGYHQALVKKNPRFLPVAMLPCTMLWPWMANSLIDKVDRQQNAYYESWFAANMSPEDQQSSTEKFVDANFSPDDEAPAVEIFCEGMMNELNFFREACGEAPLSLMDVCRNIG